MRGDQLARQWRVIRAIESSPNGLTVAEIAKREETGIRTIYRDLEALQPAGLPYPCHVKAQRAPNKYLEFYCPFSISFSDPIGFDSENNNGISGETSFAPFAPLREERRF